MAKGGSGGHGSGNAVRAAKAAAAAPVAARVRAAIEPLTSNTGDADSGVPSF